MFTIRKMNSAEPGVEYGTETASDYDEALERAEEWISFNNPGVTDDFEEVALSGNRGTLVKGYEDETETESTWYAVIT